MAAPSHGQEGERPGSTSLGVQAFLSQASAVNKSSLFLQVFFFKMSQYEGECGKVNDLWEPPAPPPP